MNIALPSAQADLGFDDAQRQWIITAYALAFGSLLLLGGRLSDLFGRKRAFLTGLVASILGGLAPGFELLVAARALQGVFGALLAPAALSLLTTTFTAGRERARAFGVFAAGFVGPPLAAAMYGYTTAFAVAAGLFVVGAVVVGFLIPAGRTPETGRTGPVTEPAGTGLAGAVRDAAGAPVADATLTLVDTTGRQTGLAVSDDAGAYVLRATPGDHLLVAGAGGRAPHAQRIVLVDGLTARADVVLDRTAEPVRT